MPLFQNALDARPVASATSISPPKIGRPSTQLACARASRCMKGDSPALSGVNRFGATSRVSTSLERMASISTSSASDQAMKAVRANRVGLMRRLRRVLGGGGV